MGYTDANNPSGDSNLLGTFIWKRALEKKGISHLDWEEHYKRVQEDNWLELQKLKQRRPVREVEKARREQELEQLRREEETEYFKYWEEQESNFLWQQESFASRSKSETTGGPSP